jgi:hypothetical protein
MGGRARARSFSSARAALGLGQRSQVAPPTANASKATNEAASIRASISTREAGGVQSHLQRVEVEARGRRDHDLAIHDAAVGQRSVKRSCRSGK